mmetsp:Transcript_38031/g.68502  ORF Transcript_38031/g.68502 Transcript_38031/m.68502 type:complete len:974 (+) Transcript_38031:49-2970(+)
MVDSGERIPKSGSHGESTIHNHDHDEPPASKRRRRPLHSHHHLASITTCLLLASTSTLILADDTTRTLIRHSSLRRKLAVKFCPGEYTGKAPTSKCSGYVSCTDGKPTSAVQACAAGTAYDVKSGTCTWPDSVTCKVGDDLLVQLGLSKGDDDGDDTNNSGNNGKKDDVSKFCPDRYTGRAPSAKCGGYVQCKAGVEGLSAKCPPQTKFNSMTSLCEYNLDQCEMLVGDNPSDSDYVGVNELDKYCPVDYSGRAPTHKCEGYVDCRAGKAKRSKNCPGETKFDIMMLACTFSETGCDALEVEGTVPTPSPNSEMVQLEPIVEGCPEGHTGYITIPGCEQYIYCVNGAEKQRFDCSAGTLFFKAGGYCNWADQVTCDTNKLPTASPTPNPSYMPTIEPTFVPTELDIMGDVFYPNFSDGVCLGDGRYPSDVGRQYLFHSAGNCCEVYFATNMENCLRASRPTPAPTPSAGKEWYPDYNNEVCKNDGNYGAWESNFFFTYAECCEFKWIDTVTCLRNMPSISFYPDYNTDSCRNDGMQSPFEDNTFGSLEECCHFEWIDYGLCITGGRQPSNPTQNVPDVAWEYYPDYQNNVCHCDMKQTKYEINIFSSYEACCQFTLIDTNICRQYKVFQEDKCVDSTQASAPPPSPPPPSPPAPAPDPVWYPDVNEGLCRDDGKHPGGVLLTVSYQECCKRFMSLDRQDCKAKSEAVKLNGPADPDPSNHCTVLNGNKCKKDSQCEWDGGTGRCDKGGSYAQITPSPTPNPTPWPTRKPNPKPTNRPQLASTPKPTNKPQPAPTPGDVCSGNTRKQCIKDDTRCNFDEGNDACYMIKPLSAPVKVNSYYPDYFHSVCLNDGKQIWGDESDAMYDNVKDCCKNQWIDYKTCMKHASGKRTIEELSGRAGSGSEDVVDVGHKVDVDVGHKEDVDKSNPYYPDYFYNVCRNDGQQSTFETNVFDTMGECCGMQYIDYDSCMSNAGS